MNLLETNNLFKTTNPKQNMKNALKIISGLILLVIPIYLIFPGMPLETWGTAALDLIKGGITILVLLAGLILIILGINEIKR